VARGFAEETVDPVLSRLAEQGLVSDARYVAGYVAERMGKGFGPLRIRAELRERGVEDALIGRHLDQKEETWMTLLRRIHDKKFGRGAPLDRTDLARRARFLEYRGFTASQVSRFLDLET
jgi:regulatory protein